VLDVTGTYIKHVRQDRARADRLLEDAFC